MTSPVIAAAAATIGLANRVLDPGPCLPSKFLFDVLTAYFPVGILSSFIARQAEHPGSLSSNPDSFKIFKSPSSLIAFSTLCEPGTNQAVTLGAFYLPLTIFVNALKSSILPLVQLPRKTKSIFLPRILSPFE